MGIFWCNILHINLVNSCTVFHIQCHSWRCNHVIHCQMGRGLQFFIKTGGTGKYPTWANIRSLFTSRTSAPPETVLVFLESHMLSKKATRPTKSSSLSFHHLPLPDLFSWGQALFPAFPQMHRMILNQWTDKRFTFASLTAVDSPSFMLFYNLFLLKLPTPFGILYLEKSILSHKGVHR